MRRGWVIRSRFASCRTGGVCPDDASGQKPASRDWSNQRMPLISGGASSGLTPDANAMERVGCKITIGIPLQICESIRFGLNAGLSNSGSNAGFC